jgi:hypothetical protein
MILPCHSTGLFAPHRFAIQIGENEADNIGCLFAIKCERPARTILLQIGHVPILVHVVDSDRENPCNVICGRHRHGVGFSEFAPGKDLAIPAFEGLPFAASQHGANILSYYTIRI